jgi:hypothetical protein
MKLYTQMNFEKELYLTLIKFKDEYLFQFKNCNESKTL